MKTNYHSHNQLCKHAIGSLEDYALKAIEKGYDIFGFSDHCPLSEKLASELYSRRMNFDDYHNIYLPECDRLIDKYKDKIKLLKSVEVEYFEELDSMYPALYDELDYLILGQHYYHYQNDYISTYKQMDDDRLNAFVNDCVKGLDTGYFKILAHPDIFLIGYPFWEEECEDAARRIIEACIRNNVLLEINANGVRNNERHKRYIIQELKDGTKRHLYAYPNYNFFKLAATYKNAKFILNDDCHNTKHIEDDATAFAKKLCDELGIKLEEELPLNH